MMKARPPDPAQSAPPSLPNNPTAQNPNQTTADAILINQRVNGTVHNIASNSLPPATDISSQNRANLIHSIDSQPQQTPTLQFSDHIVHVTNTSDQLHNSGNLTTGKNGVSTSQSTPKDQQNTNNTQQHSFPKLTTNFDPPTRLNKAATETATLAHTTPARQNVTMAQQPQPQSVKFPTVQQLNYKFNHFPHQPTQANQPNAGLTNLSNAVATVTNVPPPIPPNVTPSYATRLKASQPDVDQIIELQAPLITTKQGLPAVLFNRDDFMVKLASKCRFTLIGKFSTTMPKLEVIRKSLTSQLQIKGNCKVTHFNSTHVYIDLDNEIDHSIVWNKERIYIEGRSMRLLVWTPTFTPQVETTFAPVWVVLPELPWHCYTMPFVTKLLEPIGRVLFFDAASIQKSRGSVAKVKVEIDITKPRPPHLWLGFPQAEGDVFGDGRWQELQFESIPDYCNHCMHQGHSFHHCKVRIREEEYQKRKKDQEEKEKDKDPIQNTSSDQQRDQPESSNQKVNKSSYERGQTTGTTIKPQAKHQAIIAAKKIDIRNTVKQVYVPRNAAQPTVDFSPAEVPHATNSLVGQKISTDTGRVSNQRTLVNTKNSFDVLIDVDAAEVSEVETGNTAKKISELQGTISHETISTAEPTDALQLSAPLTANGKNQPMDGLTSAAMNQNVHSSATCKSAAKESTKTWIERSFGKLIAPETAAVKLAKSHAQSPNTAGGRVDQQDGCDTGLTTLTPTAQLVDICKAKTRMNNTPRQSCSTFKKTINPPVDSTVAMTVHDGNVLETYFLGDIFSEAQNNDKVPTIDGKTIHIPKTSGKHNWNVNAPDFVPKASSQVGLGVLQNDSDSDSDESEVSLPSDGELLERMNLYDTKGLLRRQNIPPKELPTKIPIVPPDFVDSDPEYEDEDEFSTAQNDMHAARIGALSPRVEEAKKPKLVKKERAPLERRTQPPRSLKRTSNWGFI